MTTINMTEVILEFTARQVTFIDAMTIPRDDPRLRFFIRGSGQLWPPSGDLIDYRRTGGSHV